ncbi:GntR family transcriptional regulator [Actinomadura roseirufa]|uniref:GntR family transcriptional regulator n=1 Tax=Actinomadura roseirufa TaxID=2094049 RepID=UPI0010411C2C|nr:GntR family transcriptional regulator [Actinomadura roseirufa]
MVKREGGESLAVAVYARLRSAILDTGELVPGERLRPAELSGRYGVSLSVVREALGLLAAKGLVRIERNRGFRVTPLSPEVLADLTEARVINEGAALRLSVERGDVAWESEVLAAHHRLAGQPLFLDGDPPPRNGEWARAHIEFHHVLIKACGNSVLLDICSRLSDTAELYRAWSAAGTREVRRDVAAEHKGLLDAALARDADLAARRFEEHVTRTRRILTEFGLPNSGAESAARTATP